MSKFKVGERVAFYDGYDKGIAKVMHVDGDVMHIQNPSIGINREVHYKQCRKIKPKKEPRKVWLHEEDLSRHRDNLVMTALKPDPSIPGLWIEFEEVLK